MERKQKDWEFDEPEPSDYALFVQQIKGLIAWAIVMLGLAMIIAAVVVK
jgi:hypothetical protein